MRIALSQSQHAFLSSNIIAHLMRYVNWHGMTALYYPIKNEVNVLGIARKKGNFCLPVVEEGTRHLSFRRFMHENTLIQGKYGIMQPGIAAETCIPDTILVPLVAFDRKLHRIGYGGGYYDATLADLRKTKEITAIGVAFSLQEIAHVPQEKYDIRLDAIVTETEIL